VQVAAAYHEGATGGASITASTFTFGGTDAIGLTDSDQYQGGAYTATRWLATGAREGLITAGTLGSAQLARAGVYGARYTTVGLNSFDAGRSAYDVAEGVRNGDGLQAGLGALGLAGGARAIGEVADTRRLVGAGDGVATSGVPNRLARVVDARFGNSASLGGPRADDVFVTAAEDVAGITNSADMARRLTLLDDAGKLRSGPFSVIEFENPVTGLASPVFRTNPGFLQGGFTRGGAREFVLPNGQVRDLTGVTRRVVE